jgi:hypothetical protein
MPLNALGALGGIASPHSKGTDPGVRFLLSMSVVEHPCSDRRSGKSHATNPFFRCCNQQVSPGEMHYDSCFES